MLLSLLTLGPKTYDPIEGINFVQDGPAAIDLDTDNALRNPFYRILARNLPLVLVAMIYLLAWLVVSGSTVWYSKDRRGNGWQGRLRRTTGPDTAPDRMYANCDGGAEGKSR